jgi:hypothetical protein
MEIKDFTGFSISDEITDPEEREFLELVNKVIMLSLKKGYTLALLARINEESDVTAIMGCSHCVDFLLGKVIKETHQFRDLLMNAIIRSMIETMPDELKNKQDTAGKGSAIEQLVNHAKKNSPAGN